MARQVIDTTTANSPIGDPAKTAFEKCNFNFSEIYGWAGEGGLASLIGGNSFSGPQNFNGRVTSGGAAAAFWLQDRNGDRDYIWYSQDNLLRLASGIRGGATADLLSVNAAGNMLVAGTLTTVGDVRAGNAVQTGYVFQSANSEVVLAPGVSGQVTLRPRGSGDIGGQATLTANGTMTVVSLTQTSSSDVKDYLEGFEGDAESILERLVIITHQYRKEFLDDGGLIHISFLADNVLDVFPQAVEGGNWITVSEPYQGEETYMALENFTDENGDEQIREVERVREATLYRDVERYVPHSVNLGVILALAVRAGQQKSRKLRQHENRIEAVTDQADLLAQRLTALEIVTARLDELTERLATMEDLAQRVAALEAAA